MESDFFDNWTTQLRKGILELGVLAALRGRRLYGYDIVKRLGNVPGLVISEGTVYPILSRFKREGLVTTTLVESNEGPARKYYRPTSDGYQALAAGSASWRSLVALVGDVLDKPLPATPRPGE